MGDQIRGEFPAAEVELVQSWGGVFEVRVNGDLVFSKKQAGRFPDFAEIREHLA